MQKKKQEEEKKEKEEKDDEARSMPSAGSCRKSLLGHQGVILVDFLPRGEITNATRCIQMFQELLCTPCDMHLQGNTHILQHKNA